MDRPHGNQQQQRNLLNARGSCDDATWLTLLVRHNAVELLRAEVQNLQKSLDSFVATNRPYNITSLMQLPHIIPQCQVTHLSALHMAVILGREECARILIEAGANIDLQDAIGATPLHYACAIGSRRMVKLLKGANAALSLHYANFPWNALDIAYFKHASINDLLMENNLDAEDLVGPSRRNLS